MPVDFAFILQCGLSVSLGLCAQSFLDTEQFMSIWVYVSIFFVFCLSGLSLFTAYDYSFSIGLQMSPAILFVSCSALLFGFTAKLLKFSIAMVGCVVFAVVGLGSAALYFDLWQVHPELSKLSASILLFCCVCFVRSAARDYFLSDLGRAALMSLLLTPVIFMVAGMCFIVLSAIADLLKFPPRWFVNVLVFYGIFHSPNVVMMLFFFKYQAARPDKEDSIV